MLAANATLAEWPSRVLAQPFGASEFQALASVSRETLEQFEIYADHLARWSRAMNLVGRDSLNDIWRRNFWDSAQLLPLLPNVEEGPRVIADLGSGAGFPGMVLAILGAGQLHLIESDRKKAVFLREVARDLKLDVRIHAQRIESTPRAFADIATARALAPLDRLVTYAQAVLKEGGKALFLKGQGVDRELTLLPDMETLTIEQFPSRSDPSGVILRIGGLAA